MRRFARYVLPVLAYAGAIFLLSSRSSLPSPGVVGLDKLAHFLVYAGLGYLAARALGGYGNPPGRAAALGFVLAVAYGATDEVHQMFVPHRTAEWLDLLADALGSGLGAAAYLALGQRQRKEPGR